MLIKTGNIAGIYWVGTHSDYRGRGHGSRMIQRAISDGQELGCALATLQASEMGEPIYRRMGFDAPIQYRFWLWEPQAKTLGH
jgi:predicted acetyltransferase